MWGVVAYSESVCLGGVIRGRGVTTQHVGTWLSLVGGCFAWAELLTLGKVIGAQ